VLRLSREGNRRMANDLAAIANNLGGINAFD